MCKLVSLSVPRGQARGGQKQQSIFSSSVLPIVVLLVAATTSQLAVASYSGTFVSATPITPIPLGKSLNVDVVVQNTGTDWWEAWDYPAWYTKVDNPSWSAGWSNITSYSWDDVAPGATATKRVSLSPSSLPGSAGSYSARFSTWYNKYDDGYFYSMSGNYKTVSFSLYSPAPNTWSKGAGTLNWGDSGNWSAGTVADYRHDVKLTNAGLTAGDTINLGGDRTVNSLAVDSTTDFTLGGGSGTLTLKYGGLSRTASSSGNQTIARPVDLGVEDIAWNIAGSGQLAMAGAISGDSRAMIKAGDGTLALSAANSYTGATSVNAGTLLLGTHAPSGAIGALGNATSNVTLGDTSGSAAAALLVGGPCTIGRNISVRSGSSGAATLGGANTAGTAIFAGNITLSKNVVLTAAPGGTVDCSGTVSGSYNATKTGDGTLRLAGDNTYTGSTTVTSGTLEFTSIQNVASTSASALGKPANATSGKIALGSGTTGATLRYVGTAAGGHTSNRAIDLASTTGAVAIDASGTATAALKLTSDFTATGAGAKTLVLTGSSTADNTIAGKIVDNSSTNNTSLVKSGPGKWVLSAANSFTGESTVQDGTLVYNIASGSPVVVAGQDLTISGGRVDAGGVVDPFTHGTDNTIHMDVRNNAALNITAGSKGVAALTGTGTTTISQDALLTADSITQGSIVLSGQSGHPAKLVIRPSGSPGHLRQEHLEAAVPCSFGSVATLGSGSASQVPEPGTLLMLVAAGLCLACLWRKRKRRAGCDAAP